MISSENRWNRTNIVFAVMAAIATMVLVIYTIVGPKDRAIVIHNYPPGDSKKVVRRDPPVVSHHQKKDFTPIIASKKNYNGLRIIYAGALWQNDMVPAIAHFFSAKGYLVSEAGPGSNKENFDKLITAECTITEPKKITGSTDPIIIEYTVQLKMQFYDENGTRNCGQRTYSQNVATSESDNRNRVIRQAFVGLLGQLQREKEIPFYITQ